MHHTDPQGYGQASLGISDIQRHAQQLGRHMGTHGRSSQHNTLNLRSPSCGSPPDELAVRKRGVSPNLCLAEKARDSHASLLSFCSLLASCLGDHHLLLLTSLGQQAASHGPHHGGRAQQDTGSIQERKEYTG